MRFMSNPGCTFTDDHGNPVPSVGEAEMREIDRIAIEETGPNLFQMMENAGRNVALTAIDMLGGDWPDVPIVVLAGTGGNGGGGITAARHLRNHGGNVTVIITSVDGMGEIPAAQLHVYRNSGGAVHEDPTGEPSLIIDALIGYSLTGALRGRSLELIEWANDSASAVLSVDLPSGVDATTGAAAGAAIEADTTLTLALPKSGLCSSDAGKLILGDIGIPAAVYAQIGIHAAGRVFGGHYRLPLTRVKNERR